MNEFCLLGTPGATPPLVTVRNAFDAHRYSSNDPTANVSELDYISDLDLSGGFGQGNIGGPLVEQLDKNGATTGIFTGNFPGPYCPQCRVADAAVSHDFSSSLITNDTGTCDCQLSLDGAKTYQRFSPAGRNSGSFSRAVFSYDGTQLIVTEGNGQPGRVYFCSNVKTCRNLLTGLYEPTIIELQPAGNTSATWDLLAGSSDLSIIYLGANGGRLWKGALASPGVWRWTELRPAGNVNVNWTIAKASSDGQTVYLFRNVAIYSTHDAGTSFTLEQPAGAGIGAGAIGMTPDGTVVYVNTGRIVFGGNLRNCLARGSAKRRREYTVRK